jgi:hypothetical protein
MDTSVRMLRCPPKDRELMARWVVDGDPAKQTGLVG